MSLSTFSSERSLPRLLRAGVLVVICFLCLDRGLFWFVSEASHLFYQSGFATGEAAREFSALSMGRFNTLIMGSSRAREGVLPIHLYENSGLKAHNAGGPGRYPRFHYHYYQRFKQKNGIPRVVIYGLDYFLFEKNSNPAQLAMVTGNASAPLERIDFTGALNPGSALLSRISCLYRAKPKFDEFGMDVLDALALRLEKPEGNDGLPEGVSGYRGLYGTQPTANRGRPSRWATSGYSGFPGVEGRWFEDLLKELIRDRVHVFLVAIPDWIGVFETNVEHEAFSADFKALATRSHRIEFLDYTSRERFPIENPEFFVDGGWGERASHLSVFGARRFNRMLGRELENRLR